MIKITKPLAFVTVFAGMAFCTVAAFAVQDCELNGAYANGKYANLRPTSQGEF